MSHTEVRLYQSTARDRREPEAEFLKTYLMVGEAPPRDGVKRHLQMMLACGAAGVPPYLQEFQKVRLESPKLAQFVLRCAHVNLLAEYPGDGLSKGASFPMSMARASADRLRNKLSSPRIGPDGRRWVDFDRTTLRLPDAILLAGRRVAAAFGVSPNHDFFHMYESCPQVCGMRAFVVPHPSGVSRWWNCPENRMHARHFLEVLGG